MGRGQILKSQLLSLNPKSQDPEKLQNPRHATWTGVSKRVRESSTVSALCDEVLFLSKQIMVMSTAPRCLETLNPKP